MPAVFPMQWDVLSARACVVTRDVADSPVPVLGTPSHGIESPLPYGLAVYSVDSTGTRKPLPLYYVSEKLARARGRGVKEGWYVAAVPETDFELHVSAVTPSFPSVNGVKPEKGRIVSADVVVDGAYLGQFTLNRFLHETVAPGFIHAHHHSGHAVVRKFRFQRRATTSGDDGAARSDDDNCGAISVKMVCGQAFLRPRRAKLVTNAARGGDAQVSEVEAVKAGKSIDVAKNGAKGQTFMGGSPYILTILDPKEVGGFTVFLRERFWLKSRSIIDAEGNPWAPTTNTSVIDVDVPESPDQTVEKASECEAYVVDQPVKKPVREIVRGSLPNMPSAAVSLNKAKKKGRELEGRADEQPAKKTKRNDRLAIPAKKRAKR